MAELKLKFLRWATSVPTIDARAISLLHRQLALIYRLLSKLSYCPYDVARYGRIEPVRSAAGAMVQN